MSALKNLVFAICVLSVAYTVLMMLVPDRYRGELRSVLALVMLTAFAAIAVRADISDISPQLADFGKYGGISENDRLIQSELETRIGEYISSLLSENGIVCKKLSVGTTIDSERRISITVASLQLDPAYEDREDVIYSVIKDKIGDIEIQISYEES